MSDHFTCVIEVKHTQTPTSPPASFNSRNDPPRSEGNREVTEVAKLVIRADSIDALIEKAKAHLQLLGA